MKINEQIVSECLRVNSDLSLLAATMPIISSVSLMLFDSLQWSTSLNNHPMNNAMDLHT